MDPWALIGIVVPTGLAGLGVKTLITEWKSSPFVEVTANRTVYEHPNNVAYELRISNRRDRPLLVRRYRVSQHVPQETLRAVPVPKRHTAEGADPFGFIAVDARIPPFLTTMPEWPFIVIKGSMKLDSPFVRDLVFEIDAPHRRLWRARERIETKALLARW